jgi:hypothetical protein
MNMKNGKTPSMALDISKKETILVVDDDVGSTDSLRMILSPFYEVHTVPIAKKLYVASSPTILIS